MLRIDQLQQQDFDSTYKVFNSITSTNWTYSLFMQSVIKGHSVVAKYEGEIVGYCICDRVLDELTVEDIAVSDGAKRRGVAKQMLLTLVDIAKNDLINSVSLEVRRSNKAARALYRSIGFELVAERKDYYPAYKGLSKEDALILKYLIA